MSVRKAWCPTCNLVDYVDGMWRCRWCMTVTMGGGTRYRRRAARFATVRVVREAHRLHAEGHTVREAAEQTIAETGYVDVGGYEMTLRECWALLGLPTRSRSHAQQLRKMTRKEPPRRVMPPSYRADVDTQHLAELYADLGSTTRVARLVGMSQQGVHHRLSRAGVITPRPRKVPA